MRSHAVRCRAVTLVELLITLAATALIIASSARAVIVAASANQRAIASRERYRRDAEFENRLRALIGAAYLSPNTTNANSFLVGGDGAQNQDSSLLTRGNSLTFTALGSRIPLAYLESEGMGFEELNSTYGPVAGVVEISLSLTPIGQAPVNEGLFLRRQIPADGDLTQGGTESLLEGGITEISFEFWDGNQWLTEWDTEATNDPRLPASVRVTYRRDQEDANRVVVVQLPLSDVTPDNPANVGGAT